MRPLPSPAAPLCLGLTALGLGSPGCRTVLLDDTGGGDDLLPLGTPSPAACGADEATCWTFASLPDLLNCDVASARTAPGWDGGEDSTSTAWEEAVGFVLDEVAAADPAFVLVAGDAVNGQWFKDSDGREVFGPVDTWADQRAAIDAAAGVYYPAWRARFEARGLVVHQAVGDHELGDNLWGVATGKAFHVERLKERFAEHATLLPDGSPRYAERPEDTPYADTAYAFDHRPADGPGLRVVTVDVFRQDDPNIALDEVEGSVLATVDGAQLDWLEAQLADAAADPGIAHVIVQGHTPVLGPVRISWSSGMMLRDHDDTTAADQADQGADTELWQALTRGGATAWLAGEVHDTTLTPSPDSGPVQVAHGAHLGRSSTFTWLLVHVRPDRLDLELREVAMAQDGDPIWQTGPRCAAGEPRVLDPRPRVGGTARLVPGPDGVAIPEASGRLVPVPAGSPDLSDRGDAG